MRRKIATAFVLSLYATAGSFTLLVLAALPWLVVKHAGLGVWSWPVVLVFWAWVVGVVWALGELGPKRRG